MATNVNFSLIKGLAILDLITEGRPEITTAIVVNELGMNTATAHRFLMTLEEAGALTRLQRGTYVLGHQISELGLLAMKANPLLATVQPILDSLCLKINELSVCCAVAPTWYNLHCDDDLSAGRHNQYPSWPNFRNPCDSSWQGLARIYGKSHK
ncbi:helix-turn-helix domain-containing protein [Rhizobium nepotum]|uniref:helix-turn-helix domain-containing protein n=1 Tax=Rhizobium nepotum TaxID=1035271 RepID=UPI003CF4F0AA